uniref:Uncharacterized protein n=1 Tax=Mycolicibacterium phage phi1_186018 TaxID=3236641 RepID=A0AB39AKF1_9CAUD
MPWPRPSSWTTTPCTSSVTTPCTTPKPLLRPKLSTSMEG